MAIRECTSNCIRHAGGTKIFADCRILGGASVLTLTNDGRAPETPVQEGGGLSGLRRRVEQASGQMTVETRPRFALAASIPGANLAPELCRQRQIDLILMDVQTENRENGLSAAAQIRREYPQIKIVIVTSLIDAEVLRQAKQLGADSLWYKDSSQERLMDIVRRTLAGERIFPDAPPVTQIGTAKRSEFTEAEMRVLRCLVQGMSYTATAEALGVDARTVKFHVSNMLQKTSFENKLQLAVAAIEARLTANCPEE